MISLWKKIEVVCIRKQVVFNKQLIKRTDKQEKKMYWFSLIDLRSCQTVCESLSFVNLTLKIILLSLNRKTIETSNFTCFIPVLDLFHLLIF